MARQMQADAAPTILILHLHELLGDAILHVAAYRALRAARPHHRIIGLYHRDTAFNSSLRLVRGSFFDEIVTGVPTGRELVGFLRRLPAFADAEAVLDFRMIPAALWGRLAVAGQGPRYAANVPGYVLGKPAGGYETRPPHYAQRCHRAAELAVGRTLPFDPSLPVLPQARARAAELLPAGDRYLGIAPGPERSEKFWPRERLSELARAAIAMGLRPLYLLGPAETEHRGWIAESTPTALLIDLDQAGGDAAFLPWLMHAAAERMVGCVAVEGGLGHLVASRGTPLTTLAGPTDAIHWKPMTPSWWLVRAQEFGSRRMDAIPVERVVAAVRAMIAAGDRPSFAARVGEGAERDMLAS